MTWPTGSSPQGGLVEVHAASNSDVWLSATAPQGNEGAGGGGGGNAVFVDPKPVVDTANATVTPVFSNRTVDVGQSAIGLGTLLDVGGVWAGGSAGYSGFSQVYPQSFGLGFEGYHQGFSQANPNPSAPQNGQNEPPSGPPGSYFNGDNPPGGDGPPSNGHGPDGPPNQGPPDNHNGPPYHGPDHGPNGTPVTATPEPGSIVLMATGLLVMIPVVRRRRRA